MIDLTTAEPDVPARRRSRRRLWIVLAVVVVLVAAGATVAVAVSLRYLHAAPLSTNGGGWSPPDNQHIHRVEDGRYSAAVIAPRPGHTQTFELNLNNDSPVSQTVLGLTDGRLLANSSETAEPQTLEISMSSVYRHRGQVPYTSKPVTIPPGGQYSLRLAFHTARNLWKCGRREYFDSLSLQVRVGAFTRTEKVDFNFFRLEIRSASPPC